MRLKTSPGSFFVVARRVYGAYTCFCRSRRDTFIYEYVGDVLSSPSMKKRMRDYGKEGIQHFYFMMLQKDEVRLSHRLLFLMSAKRARHM